jgi:7,8-dihydropterin-6-yl-methyl-4-(beta-D-ribofuranosyl)aminobenzene 5'-phosphate synthase
MPFHAEATMQLTVLVDNNTLIDRYLLGEPGISLFIEDQKARVLFDLGYSDAFMTNARRLGIDLMDLDWVALSHGHLDHTWGLDPLIRGMTEAMIEKQPVRRPTLVAHPDVFATKTDLGLPEIGSLISLPKVSRHMNARLTRSPLWLTDKLVYLGEIPRIFSFEHSVIGEVEKDGAMVPDTLADDSSLAYISAKGLVIITGCAHAGICNTVEYAKAVCKTKQILDIVGGFHLQSPSQARMEQTTGYLAAQRPASLHPCHCTDLASKIALAGALPVQEVGSGLRLNYED